MVIYIDANVMYSYLFETPMSESAEAILEHSSKVTSKTAVNEAIYVSFRKLARGEGVTNIHDLKRFVKEEKGKVLLRKSYFLVMELIELASVELIDEEDNFEVIARTSEKYGLLPNDATIVATCIKHGITEIATFDKDFENVSFLKIVRG